MADPFRTIPLDPAAVRDTAYLRLAGAVICVVMAVWLGLIQPSWRIGAWAIAGALIAVFWIRRYVKARRQVSVRDEHFLALEPNRLRLSRGSEEPVDVPWIDVAAVDVDEDRLEVKLRLISDEPLYIEPVYGGLGVYELAEAVRRAYVAART